jgi:hypothetical protein
VFNEQKLELIRCPIGEGLKIDGEVNATPHEQMQREVDYVRALLRMSKCSAKLIM